MDAPVFFLIYTSIATKLMMENSLIRLLEQSRLNNDSYAITGMLLYMECRFLNKLEGRFIQFLEGNESDVRGIYARIIADERNHSILLLASGKSETPYFAGWSMGFKVINEEACRDIPGLFRLQDHFLAQTEPTEPLNYLQIFYDLNCELDSNRRQIL